MRALCLRCQNTGLTAAAQLKRVSESLSRQQSNLFTKKSTARRPDFNTQVDFAKVENYMHELRELTELAASKVVQSLVHSRPAHFKAISLKENALQSSLSTIVQLLEYGGANVKQNDFAHDGPAQQCMDVSTQSRLDLLHSMDTEPRSIPLQHTMLRRRIVLDLIHFRQMSDRIEEVNIAYENTLEWIFRDKDYNLAWSSFPDFLESSSDMSYWINGKAGSGKSTLLRFLVKHEKTLQHLRTWSEGKLLQIGHFFSWNLGTSLQKTGTGLLQSLIYQVLERNQNLIHRAFPDLWHYIDTSHQIKQAPLSFREIKHAFIRLIKTSATHMCFCFFVDGIDEFDEDHSHIADLLLSLTAPNLKFVLSSRPIDACLDRFDHCPKLRLQDLTADDIETYIDAQLSSHSTMREVMYEEPKAAAELVRELKDRASGVFLWVKLVVASLLIGLRKGDNITELNLRLRELPPDLSKLYASMLGKMDPSYSRQAAVLFRLVRTASTLLDGQGMPTQYLAIANREFRSVVNGRPVAFETVKMIHWCGSLMRQLYSRCGGLIELSSSTYTPDWWSSDLNKLSQEDRMLLSSHVQFMHRTVTEYLYQDHVWDVIVSESVKASTFDPHENLAYAALHMMKIAPLADDLPAMQAYRWAQTLIRAAREFECGSQEPLEDLIDEMDLVLRDHHDSPTSHWSTRIEVEPANNIAVSQISVLERPIQGLISFAAFVGLSEYVDVKLEKRDFVLGAGETIQQMLFQSLFSTSNDWRKVDLRVRLAVVSCLLERGADPNKISGGLSFWQCCLQQVGALNCQARSLAGGITRRRRSSHRTRIDTSPGKDGPQCKCLPQDIQIWSQLLVCCLTAGAKHEDIDYLAPFSQDDQRPPVCCFSQLCQTMYKARNENKSTLLYVPDSTNERGLSRPINNQQWSRTHYGTNIIQGSARAHLGDEYTYGNKITHVHYNYFGTGKDTSSEVSPRAAFPTPGAESISRTTRDALDVYRSGDFVDVLAQLRAEVLRSQENSSKLTSKLKAPDIGPRNVNSMHEEPELIQDFHWRGETCTFTDAQCSNPNCLTKTTRGWDYVAALKGLLCFSCYQYWQDTGLLRNDTLDRSATYRAEELFEQPFAKMSLVTTTNGSESSDDEDELLYDYTRSKSIRIPSKPVSTSIEQDDILATLRATSINVDRPASSAYSNLYDISSGMTSRFESHIR